MLSITNLTKNFGTHTAVQKFSLTVEESEFVTLLGPSGSGKTTVLRMIAGLLDPSSGSISIGGSDVTALAPQHRNIGLVFQSYALFPNMTAWENIAFPLRIRRWQQSDIRKRVDGLLDLVGLSHRANFHPDSLSGGERQRTALARALAFHPPLLLLDEPLSALDAKVRQGLRSFLKDIQRTTGVTTLMVTHDQEEALELSDRIVVMNTGEIEQIGSPADVYYRPLSTFTAHFIGRVNALDAVVRQVGDTTATVDWHGAQLRWSMPQNERWTAGQSVRLFVRPESVELRQQPAPGLTPARVTHIGFAGPLTNVHCKVGDTDLVADVLSSQAGWLTTDAEVYVNIAMQTDSVTHP